MVFVRSLIISLDKGEYMYFEEFIHQLLKNKREILELLRDADCEDDVIIVLANFTKCQREVSLRAGAFNLIVDLLCDGLAIEVEFNKLPHEGVHQAIAYRVFLGLNSALIHVLDYCTKDYVDSFKALLKALNHLNIRGVIIDVANGEINVI